MFKVIFDVGYPVGVFMFNSFDDATKFGKAALDTYTPKDGKPLAVKLIKCAGSGNSEMAHDNESI